MIAYVLPIHYITVFWSMFGLTSIHFDKKVKCSFAHGTNSNGKSVIQIKYEREGRTLSISPLMAFSTNFNCYSETDQMYFFNIKYNEKNYSKNVIVRDGTNFSGGRLVYSGKNYKVFDSGKNYYIKNLSKKKMTVNGVDFLGSGITSKWQPIDINGELVRF